MNTPGKISPLNSKYCQGPKLLITLTTKVIVIEGEGLRQPIHIFNNLTFLGSS